jgi:Ca2+-binding RTX toxin-like protein
MGQRKHWSWVLVTLLVFPLVSSGASAQEGSCTYDATSHTVTIQPQPPDIEFVIYTLKVVDSRIYFEGGPCGDANVTNTDTIDFSGLPPDAAVDEYLDLHLPFAPGFSPESTGLPEIEIILDFPGGFAGFDVYGTSRADSVVVGVLGYNVNGDNDVDVQVSGATYGDVEGRAGRDFISTAGGRGTGEPLSPQSIRLSLYGEEGRDRLVDGPYRRRVLSGGPGDDVIRAGAGNDVLDIIDWYGRDKLLGGSGRDSCFAVGRKDKTRSCERLRRP